ncbi:dabb-domain-containing protein [Bimuria novae-zelandiae CBS 107.79]|uniref:Dabb-domain-containing protein n=1 Tax=Bimuria novae-zelandiae CBS 107.79 TaxID=1447943 RepID=A0A6A5VHW4_9PLEO|nr:dabb-domain-containing protein [Bimuria novae-zelandiae CBS 107.79]
MFRSRSLVGAALGLLALFIFLLTHARTSTFGSILHTSSFDRNPQVAASPSTTHIVLFKFHDNVTPGNLKDITLQMLGLEKSCLHPTTGAPYIKSITGGKGNSPEGLQEGLTHGYVVQFSSNEDRDYYVNQDPAHDAFKKTAGPFIEKAVVFDFQDGVFLRTVTGL